MATQYDSDDDCIVLDERPSPEQQVLQLRAQVYNLQYQLQLHLRYLLPTQQRVAKVAESVARIASKIEPPPPQSPRRATWRSLLRDLGDLLFQPIALLIGYERIDYGRCPCCGANKQPPLT